MELDGFGPKEATRYISEACYPLEWGLWGDFKWPRPLLGPKSEPAAELLMSVYTEDELRHIAISITTKEKGISFARTVPFSDLERALHDRKILLAGATIQDEGDYDIGTNILAGSASNPDDYLFEHGIALFHVRTSQAGSANNIRVRGYDERKVATALEMIKMYVISPNGVCSGNYVPTVKNRIQVNGHKII